MRAFSLLALFTLALAGCVDQDPVQPTSILKPSFYNAGGGYWQVTKLDDTNDGTCDADCSLREAIDDAASGDEIRFGVTGTITLTATLQISKNLTITGPGAASLTVSGADAYRVFNVGNVTASLSGLTIADGSTATGSGGGISKGAGTLTLTDCVVSGNQATGSGGGIHNGTGTLTITDCVVSGNQAPGAGGIVSYGGVVSITESEISGNAATTGNGGGMYAYGTTLTLDRSTISGNTATGNGGGARFQLGSTTILNSTISGNAAGTTAGGIYRFQGATRIILSTITNNNAATGSGGVVLYDAGTLTDVKGSIIWGNTRAGSTADDVGGAAGGYSSLGHNLIGAGGALSKFAAEGDQTGVTNALLGTLQLNGPGTTRTHALLAGSPAIDAGSCTDHQGTLVFTDQRGVTRPQPSGGPCDIGAYERWGGNLAPSEGAQALMEDVNALGPDGTATLNGGQTKALLVTLDVVLKKLEAGQKHVALANLRAFIDKVETFIADDVLTSLEGEPLIDAAEQIIAAIEAM